MRTPAGIAGVTLGLVLAPMALAAAPAADPWAKVPAQPTGCYSSRDSFSGDSEAAMEALHQEIYRQQELNEGVRDRLANMDPMEQANRMQAFLMENPEKAMKYMEMTQTFGSAMQGEVEEESANRQRLMDELSDTTSRYEAALDQAVGPIRSRLQLIGEAGLTAAQQAERQALPPRINAAYEKVCAEWWGASSPFRGWLKSYRDFLVQERIPHLDSLEEVKLENFRILGVPAEAYRSTAAMDAVADYLGHARTIFDRRWAEPIAPF